MFVLIFPLIFHQKSKQRVHSPGPTLWPMVGNLPELWRNKLAFQWIHGPMTELNTKIACVRLKGVHVIPVTSPEISWEFLTQYDSIFASRPLTMGSKYSTRGFKAMALVPWTDHWKKMRKVVASNVINPTLLWLPHKRTEEADNLVRFVHNQSKKSTSVVDVRLTIHHYCGNVMRKMIFNKRYFRKGSNDGESKVEEVEHVESFWSLLTHINAFAMLEYIPCLKVPNLDGHEKMVSEAMSRAGRRPVMSVSGSTKFGRIHRSSNQNDIWGRMNHRQRRWWILQKMNCTSFRSVREGEDAWAFNLGRPWMWCFCQGFFKGLHGISHQTWRRLTSQSL